MDAKKAGLIRFIESYAKYSAARDYGALVGQFAETFLAAGPSGAKCVRADDFARALPRRTDLFDSLGCESARLIDMRDNWLGDRYAVVRTTWRFAFHRVDAGTERIDSESIFLVDTGSEPHRILLYLSPQDILETARQRGIVS